MSAPKTLKRVELGDPVLRKKSRRLTLQEVHSSATQNLIKQMYDTLKRSGGVGLAAPQIGKSLAIAVVNIRPNRYHPNQKKRLRFVMINPRIIKVSKKRTKLVEGCLSFVDIFGEVERPSQVWVEYRDEQGQLVKRSFHGLHAKVFQHEYDHLQGVVWIDRATNTKTFMSRAWYLAQATKNSK